MDFMHLQTCRGINSVWKKFVAQIKRQTGFYILHLEGRNIIEDYYRLLEYDAVSTDEGLGESYVSIHLES